MNINERLNKETVKGSSLQSKHRKFKIQFDSRIIHSFTEYADPSHSIWMNESAVN